MRDVDLVLEQGNASWTLGTRDAASREDRYAMTWTVQVPPKARPGLATLRAGLSELPVEISGSPGRPVPAPSMVSVRCPVMDFQWDGLLVLPAGGLLAAMFQDRSVLVVGLLAWAGAW